MFKIIKPIFRIITFFTLFLIPLTVLAGEDPLMDPFYSAGNAMSGLPAEGEVKEYVDPFSGNLNLLHTDIFLPGNGGLDLRIMRTYSSGIWGRRDIASPDYFARYERSPVGVGWTMHMGIVRNPFGDGSQNPDAPNNPVVEMPDGSRHTFFKDRNNSSQFISKEFWLYKSVGTGVWELTLTDGTVYTFQYNANAGYNMYYRYYNYTYGTWGERPYPVAQVTSIKNASQNSQITITYDRQYTETPWPYSYLKKITDSVGRNISFNYQYYNANGERNYQLLSIAVEGNSNNLINGIPEGKRTITYTKTGSFLYGVQPPVGNPWSYSYNTGTTFELQKITFPTGGTISYSYNDVYFATGQTNVQFRVVNQRTTGGIGITPGTWTYTHGSEDTTTVTAPDGIKEVHKYNGWSNCSSGSVWRVGLPLSKEIFVNNVSVQLETFVWSPSSPISLDGIANANWSGLGSNIHDFAISVPLLSSHSIVRGWKTYKTDISAYDSSANPLTITETGDKVRTTTKTYWSNTAKNIVKNKPATESVSGPSGGDFSGNFTSAFTYDTNGNPTQINRYGVITGYAYDANGNLSSSTDANSKTTSYEWSYGRISKEIFPTNVSGLDRIARKINYNGTIKNENWKWWADTSFDYDGNQRLTKIILPLGRNSTDISYFTETDPNSPDNGKFSKREIRGQYSITTRYDGFGRVTKTEDSSGVITNILYGAYGMKNQISSNVGDTVKYDLLGRVTEITHQNTLKIIYTYSGSNVTMTDESGINTDFYYTAFGNPEEKYLSRVVDASNNTTTYARNILGSITGTTQGSILRTFSYDAKNFLTSETHPESGMVVYGRDNVGNVTYRTDALGARTYVYDALNRLIKITSGIENIYFTYDAGNNRTSMTTSNMTATYRYDINNDRFTEKSEIIAGITYKTTYEYDGNDNIIAYHYPSGRTVNYGYNSNNQVISVSGFGGSVSSINHNTAGLPTSYSFSNGINTNFTYDNRNFIKRINSGTAVNLGYTYDNNGNTTYIDNYLDVSKTQIFTYDSLSRLSYFAGSWGVGNYSYDSTGNRLTKEIEHGVSSASAYENNRLSSTTGGEQAQYTYDGTGNLSSMVWQGITYNMDYDAFGNLKNFKYAGANTGEYGYDGDGMRITKKTDSQSVIYHYDLGGRLISESDANGNLLSDYIYLYGKLIAKVDNPLYSSWIEASGATKIISDCDDCSYNIDLAAIGFNFSFFGVQKNSLLVSSNGYVTFGNQGNVYNNTVLPNSTSVNDLIAVFWDDLVIPTSGGVYYKITGMFPNRVLTIEWKDVSRNGLSSANSATFQIQLYEGSNKIDFLYLDTYFGDLQYNNGASATVGIENSTGTSGYQYSYNTAIISSGTVLNADLVLQNETIGAGVTRNYEVINTITAGPAFTIESGANVTFKAGSRIHLAPGFRAREGSIFRAKIGG